MRFIFILLLLTAHVHAATYYVSKSGSDSAVGGVSTPWLTVNKAMNVMVAGDTVLVGAGTYAEAVSTIRSGTELQRITIDGQGVATIDEFIYKHDYTTLQGFTIHGAKHSWAKVLFSINADFNILKDCVIDSDNIDKYMGINWYVSTRAPEGSDNIIEGCTIQHVFGTSMVTINGDRNIMRNCRLENGLKVDFLRLFGGNHHIHNNLFRNNLNTDIFTAWHPDFVQTFGNNGEVAHDMMIERNIIHNAPVAQISQLSGGGAPDIRDWTFQNNIYSYIGLQGSCTIPGIKYYNNIFYRCFTENTDVSIGPKSSGGSPLHFGMRKHDRIDIDDGHPEYATLVNPVTSGTLTSGWWYNVELPEIEVGTNGIVAGTTYKAYTRDSTRVVYDGVEYVNHDVFTGVSGVTDYTLTGGDNGTLYMNGSVTYNGTEYTRDQAFQADATTTFTISTPATLLYRNLVNFAHRVEVVNNVFLECGGSTNNLNGWYAISTALEDAVADYNYVGKPAFGTVRDMVPPVAVGGVGDWGVKGWYEPNGINGGNPLLTDPTNLDFRPQAGSFLIDAGDALSGVDEDFAGIIRPFGAAHDIGPYEYNDGSPPPDPPDPTAPAAPINLSQSSATTSSITIQWSDQSGNETSFQVYWSRDDGTYTLLTTTSANVTTATHSGLAANTSRYYRVRATNAVGSSEYLSGGPFYSAAFTPPNPPTNLVATVQGANTVRLTWTDNATDETHSEMERSADATAWQPMPIAPANAITYQVSGLEPSTTYYFRSRTVGPGGFSAWVQTLAVTTDPLPSVIRGGRAPRANQAAVIPP